MPNNIENKKILVVGAGNMASEYVRVLKSMNINFAVVGNGKDKAERIKKEYGIDVFVGGIDKYLENYSIDSDTYVINTVNVKYLEKVNLLLLSNGCKHLLSEKPGIISIKEGKRIVEALNGAKMYIAYNRRFYASSLAAENIIREDGGVKSFNIEFTEWRHVFDNSENKDYLDILFLANSSHVVDMAFNLAGGEVTDITSIIAGENNIPWHKSGSIFGGVGKTNKGQIFTYGANWDAPGRWAAELNTENHRLIFRPLEKLQLQDKGSVKIYDADVDYSLDEEFKPGLYKEVEAFMSDNNDGRLCTIEDQVRNMVIYTKMSGEKY